MAGLLAFSMLGMTAFVALKMYLDLMKNIQKARKTDLPYIISPFFGFGIFWNLAIKMVCPLLQRLPFTKSVDWIHVTGRQESWIHLRTAEEKYGDTWLIVSPMLICLKTSNAELGTQITTRKNDFLKPIERYKIIDLFGSSILTTEGQNWRRHRKIVAPSFSEKSNSLVFEESLRQVESMMGLWATQGGNTKEDLKVENTAVDAASLSFHVICAAGFGVPQIWPGESEEKLQESGVPGFSGLQLRGEHTMTFKKGLGELMQKLRWFVVFSPALLRKSPFKAHQAAYAAFHECKTYFNELLEAKKKALYLGENDKGSMDLMGRMVKDSEEAPMDMKSNTYQENSLSREEIIANSFIFLFAGHETTANSIHYSILYLAMYLAAQCHMQADIDRIVGRDKPTSEFSYQADMTCLYNSMVGAVMNEETRLIPATVNIVKVANGDQEVTMDGKKFNISDSTLIHLNVVGTNRNPRYWPQSPNDFIPERWLPSHSEEDQAKDADEAKAADLSEQTSFETSTSESLVKPVKGSFLSFSDGPRACPGKRFAQVEIIAVLTAMFQRYSVELDVSEWASDDEIKHMAREEKKGVYEKAIQRAKVVIRRSRQTITLQMRKGDKVPVRFVRRGTERFAEIVENV